MNLSDVIAQLLADSKHIDFSIATAELIRKIEGYFLSELYTSIGLSKNAAFAKKIVATLRNNGFDTIRNPNGKNKRFTFYDDNGHRTKSTHIHYVGLKMDLYSVIANLLSDCKRIDFCMPTAELMRQIEGCFLSDLNTPIGLSRNVAVAKEVAGIVRTFGFDTIRDINGKNKNFVFFDDSGHRTTSSHIHYVGLPTA